MLFPLVHINKHKLVEMILEEVVEGGSRTGRWLPEEVELLNKIDVFHRKSQENKVLTPAKTKDKMRQVDEDIQEFAELFEDIAID